MVEMNEIFDTNTIQQSVQSLVVDNELLSQFAGKLLNNIEWELEEDHETFITVRINGVRDAEYSVQLYAPHYHPLNGELEKVVDLEVHYEPEDVFESIHLADMQITNSGFDIDTIDDKSEVYTDNYRPFFAHVMGAPDMFVQRVVVANYLERFFVKAIADNDFLSKTTTQVVSNILPTPSTFSTE